MSNRKSKLKEAINGVRLEFERNVLDAMEQHPDWTYDRVSEHVGVSTAVVQRISTRAGKSRPVGPQPKVKNICNCSGTARNLENLGAEDGGR
jgi:hypothetical protein